MFIIKLNIASSTIIKGFVKTFVNININIINIVIYVFLKRTSTILSGNIVDNIIEPSSGGMGRRLKTAKPIFT